MVFRIFVSEPYGLIDALFYDAGNETEHNDTWENTQNRFQVTRGTEYTTITRDSSNSALYYAPTIITTDSAIEWDNNGNAEYNCICAIGNTVLRFSNYGIGVGKHIKITIEDSTIKVFVDGVQSGGNITLSDTLSEGVQFRFQCNTNGLSIIYKDFKIYSI